MALPVHDHVNVLIGSPEKNLPGSPLAACPGPMLTFEDPAYALYVG